LVIVVAWIVVGIIFGFVVTVFRFVPRFVRVKDAYGLRGWGCASGGIAVRCVI
jgi:hypothetical protein